MTPKFLTQEVAEKAIRKTLEFVTNSLHVKCRMLHVVVLGPRMDSPSTGFPNYTIEPCVIAEVSYGNPDKWEHHFDEIAQCKAMQLWHGRNDGGTDVHPHLLFQGDTVFWGGVKRDGIVVACSGVQPYFDRLIAGITADTCIALSYHAYSVWVKQNKGDFLV